MQTGKHMQESRPNSASRPAQGKRAGKRGCAQSGAFPKLFAAGLVLFTVFVLLDTFAIARVQSEVHTADFASITATAEAAETSESEATHVATPSAETTYASPSNEDMQNAENGDDSAAQSQPTGKTSLQATEVAAAEAAAQDADWSYSDDNIAVAISKLRAYDTDIYIADVRVSSAEYLKTALAQNAFGRNLKEETSDMAEANNAILAINGDYYGFRDDGYVLRNGVLYREQASSGTDALVVYADGTMAAADQDTVAASELADTGAWQVLSFGPVLIQDGKVAVGEQDEVDQAKTSNPRTAIGMVEPLHYIVVVSDGRTDESAGLSLYELAQVMKDAGATFAYNLDGGGSSTMWFQGETINNPSSGHRSGEREVSDIVYFG